MKSLMVLLFVSVLSNSLLLAKTNYRSPSSQLWPTKWRTNKLAPFGGSFLDSFPVFDRDKLQNSGNVPSAPSSNGGFYYTPMRELISGHNSNLCVANLVLDILKMSGKKVEVVSAQTARWSTWNQEFTVFDSGNKVIGKGLIEAKATEIYIGRPVTICWLQRKARRPIGHIKLSKDEEDKYFKNVHRNTGYFEVFEYKTPSDKRVFRILERYAKRKHTRRI